MTPRGAVLCAWLALAGCDRVFGIGDPYEDARGSAPGSDAPADVAMPVDLISEPSPQVLVHFDFESYENSVDHMMAFCSGCILLSTGGHSGGDVYFDGNACLSFPLSAMPAQYTIALWVKAQSTNQATLFARAQTSAPGSLQMWKLTGNSSAFEFDTLSSTSNTEPLISGPGLSTTYTQLAVTYDGAMKHLYIDGVEKSSAQAMPLAVADTTAYLGCESDTATARYNGYFDEVYVFDGAMDATQIAALHNL